MKEQFENERRERERQEQLRKQELVDAEFAKKISARFLIRGLRNTTDFEYENTISQANKHQWKDLETVFLITEPSQAFISSSIVRDLHKYGGDVQAFLPYRI